MASKNFLLFDKKFKVNKNLIAISDHWRLSLRPNQPTLGSSIISLSRYCENFSDISVEEASDLKEIISYSEDRLKQAFNYDKINYLMLMMVDPHLHFHVIPRYSKSINFAGQQWVDEKWPTPPDLGGVDLSDKLAATLIDIIKG